MGECLGIESHDGSRKHPNCEISTKAIESAVQEDEGNDILKLDQNLTIRHFMACHKTTNLTV